MSTVTANALIKYSTTFYVLSLMYMMYMTYMMIVDDIVMTVTRQLVI